MDFYHQPVLLNECLKELHIVPNGIYVDGTIGGGGHSVEIYKQLGPNGMLIGIDQDKEAVKAATDRLKEIKGVGKFTVVNANFSEIRKICADMGICSVDGILFDLGVSSYQLDNPDRGFCYMHDAELDMRMDQTGMLDARYVVNNYSEREIRNIIYKYGEERWAARIAKFIVEKRKTKQIDTTGQLVEIIKAAIPSSARQQGPHPAKRTFQAIRIEVNKEFDRLAMGIEEGFCLLKPEGRFCIITFHSLEDRIVKNAFAEKCKSCTCPSELPKCICNNVPLARKANKKPLIEAESVLRDNHRARSAKVRTLIKN